MGKRICVYENNVDRAWYNSSNVLYSECDDKENELKNVKVIFNNGGTYLYKNVKVNDYLLFRESSSQGKALNRFLKQYECEKLEKSDVKLILEEYYNMLDKITETKNVKETYIISAFPGCGKTTTYKKLCKEYNILDFESSMFDKKDFPKNYVSELKEKIGVVDIIFVSSHDDVRKMLRDENIKYYVYYPSIKRKKEMIALYEGRGNDGSFIDLMNMHFENFISTMENDESENKICLENEGDFIINDKTFNEILRKVGKSNITDYN